MNLAGIVSSLHARVPGRRRTAEDPLAYTVIARERGEIVFEDRFAAGSCLLGRSPEADVIADTFAADQVALLTFGPREHGGTVGLTALGPGLRVAGREPAVGERIDISGSAHFTAGPLAFEVVFRGGPAPGRGRVLPSLLMAASASAALVALGSEPHAPFRADASTPTPSLRSAVSGEDAGARSERLLRGGLAGLGPHGGLQLHREGGALVVGGLTTVADRDRTLELAAEIRQAVPNAPPIRLRSAGEAASNVASVTLRPDPHVVGRDGRALRPNQTFPDGGRIEAITGEEIVIDRGVAVEYLSYTR